MLRPAEKREAVLNVQALLNVSTQWASRVNGADRMSRRYTAAFEALAS